MKQRNSLFHAVTLLGLSLSFWACTSIQTKEIESPSRIPSSKKNFAGPIDFGISFSPVTEELARKFWNAYDNPNSLTAKIDPSKDFVSGEYSSLKKDHPLSKVAFKAGAQYVTDLKDWVKSKCASPDMNAYYAGVLKYAYPSQKIPSLIYTFGDTPKPEQLDAKFENLAAFWKDYERPENPYLSMMTSYNCTFEKKNHHTAPEGEQIPTFNPSLIVKPDWQLQANPGRMFIQSTTGVKKAFTLYVGLDLKNEQTSETWYGTKYGNLNDSGDEAGSAGASPVAITFWIVDNYLIPEASHGVSKSFPVPIAEFDRVTGKIVAYYDFGLLLLEAFPKKSPVVLSSVVKNKTINKFIRTKDASLFGSRAKPHHKLHQYVPAGELPASIPFWNYDRIPVGSVHFMANSFWSDGHAGSFNDALLAVFSVEQLKYLYLNGAAWINTYDGLQEDASDTGSFLQLIEGKSVDKLSPANFPAGMHVSHEIIIGGEKGREALFKKVKLVPVMDLKPYAQ